MLITLKSSLDLLKYAGFIKSGEGQEFTGPEKTQVRMRQKGLMEVLEML